MPVRPRRARRRSDELSPWDGIDLMIGPSNADADELRRLREVYRRWWPRIDRFGFDADGRPVGAPSWAFSLFVDGIDLRDEGPEVEVERLSGAALSRAVGLPGCAD